MRQLQARRACSAAWPGNGACCTISTRRCRTTCWRRSGRAEARAVAVRLLLDTHLLLWALGEPGRLDRATRALIEDGGNDVLFSAASICDAAIQTALGQTDFRAGPDGIVQAARRTGFTGCRCPPTRLPACGPAAASSRSVRSAAGRAGDGRAGAALHLRPDAAALFGAGDAGRRATMSGEAGLTEAALRQAARCAPAPPARSGRCRPRVRASRHVATRRRRRTASDRSASPTA